MWLWRLLLCALSLGGGSMVKGYKDITFSGKKPIPKGKYYYRNAMMKYQSDMRKRFYYFLHKYYELGAGSRPKSERATSKMYGLAIVL